MNPLQTCRSSRDWFVESGLDRLVSCRRLDSGTAWAFKLTLIVAGLCTVMAAVIAFIR